MKKKNIYAVAALLTVAGVGAFAFGGPLEGIRAYMTDRAETMENNFTIALDPVLELPEYFPNDFEITGSRMEFTKMIQVVNSGYIDAYGRIRISFSDSDIEKLTAFSYDGVNYYSVEDYKNHLPSGWVYNAEDDYYYYTPILVADKDEWEARSQSDMVYKEEEGGYFYKEEDLVYKGDAADEIKSVPLVKYVRTTFAKSSDIRSYSIDVKAGATAYFWGDNYKSAWENFLEMKAED